MRNSAKSQERNRRQSSDSNNSLIISSILKKPNKSKLKHQRSVRFEDPDEAPIVEYNPEHNTLSVQQYHISPNNSFTLSQSPSRTKCSVNSPVSVSKPTRSKQSSKSYIESTLEIMKDLVDSQSAKESQSHQSKSLQETKGKVVINVKYSKDKPRQATKDQIVLKVAEESRSNRASRSVLEFEDRKISREPNIREGSVVRETRDEKNSPNKERKQPGIANNFQEKYSESPIKIITVAKLSKGHEARNSPKANPKTLKLECRNESFYSKLNYYLNAKTSLSPSRVPSNESRGPIKKSINLSEPCSMESPSNHLTNKSIKPQIQNPSNLKKSQNPGKSVGINVLN